MSISKKECISLNISRSIHGAQFLKCFVLFIRDRYFFLVWVVDAFECSFKALMGSWGNQTREQCSVADACVIHELYELNLKSSETQDISEVNAVWCRLLYATNHFTDSLFVYKLFRNPIIIYCIFACRTSQLLYPGQP